jgi:hypothetical protein
LEHLPVPIWNSKAPSLFPPHVEILIPFDKGGKEIKIVRIAASLPKGIGKKHSA